MNRFRTRASAALLAGALLVGAAPATASGTLERVRAAGAVRVCVWPDYYGISFRHPRTGQLAGIDVDLSRELGAQLGVRVDYVDSSFVSLVEDVTAGRCDVAMFAIGVTPARAAVLAFTRPHVRSDFYGVATRSSRTVPTWEDMDRPGVVVAVQAGTVMEPVMRDRLRHATLSVVRAPQTREAEVQAGRADVFISDFPYTRRLATQADWIRLLKPRETFHLVSYAYAVKPGDAPWLAYLDAFLDSARRDGRLLKAAQAHGLDPIVVLE
jgi:ABC-type amino acid transport substrate-binding protein